MQTSIGRLELRLFRLYSHCERIIIMASPPLLFLAGSLAWMHVPYALTAVLLVATFDLNFLGFRLSWHALGHLARKNYKQAMAFGFVAIPLVAYMCYASAVAQMHIYNLGQTTWFQVVVVACSFILCSVFFRWYASKKALSLPSTNV